MPPDQHDQPHGFEQGAAWYAAPDGDRHRSFENLYSILGVEIFRAGTWNGDTYDVADLDQMVAAFDHVGYDPPLKLGHSEVVGERAWGWVSRLRRVGDKLVADFRDVPASLYKLIKDRAYDTVSAEIYWNIKRGSQTFARALKAIALLGAETPAVSGLAPLRTVVKAQSAHVKCVPLERTNWGPDAELAGLAIDHMMAHGTEYREALYAVLRTDKGRELSIQVYGRNGRPHPRPPERQPNAGTTERQPAGTHKKETTMLTSHEASAKLNSLAEARAAERGCSLAVAIHTTMTDPKNADLVRAYQGGGSGIARGIGRLLDSVKQPAHVAAAPGGGHDDPSAEIHDKAEALRQQQPTLSYVAAVQRVLAGNPALRRAYASAAPTAVMEDAGE